MTAQPTTCRVSFACSSVAPITLQNHLFDCSFPAFLQAGEAQMLKDMQVLQTIVPPRSCSYKRSQIVAAVIAAANELNQVRAARVLNVRILNRSCFCRRRRAGQRTLLPCCSPFTPERCKTIAGWCVCMTRAPL
jgi:hypothetical protein